MGSWPILRQISVKTSTAIQSRGLEVIARNINLRFPQNFENLEHQMEAYDSLLLVVAETDQ